MVIPTKTGTHLTGIWTTSNLDVFMNGDLVNFEVQRLTNKEMKMKTLNDELFDNGVVFTMEKD